MTLKKIVEQFNIFINNKDIQGLSTLMHDEYTFIDSSDSIEEGKNQGIKSWKLFFNKFPDYQNFFEKFTTRGNLVIVEGYSICSYNPLSGKSIWTAKVKDEKISEWRVYKVTKKNKKFLMI